MISRFFPPDDHHLMPEGKIFSDQDGSAYRADAKAIWGGAVINAINGSSQEVKTESFYVGNSPTEKRRMFGEISRTMFLVETG